MIPEKRRLACEERDRDRQKERVKRIEWKGKNKQTDRRSNDIENRELATV